MTILGIIFARGGSKGIPNKNLQLVAGKPLVTRAIETAQAIAGIDRL
ncbi:acylneuraminate cytidylyltransferase family protein, partial [bacterium]|nr:acylneuraminate cytidylyltransferase family protein [bacterium]